MAKRSSPKTTPEQEAFFEETSRLLRERVALREAREREVEEEHARAAESWIFRLRLRIARAIAP